MNIRKINIGDAANDGTGDKLRNAFDKVNQNFTEVQEHDHDGTYSPVNHDHAGVYAPVNHNHDSDYAAANHNHDQRYFAASEGASLELRVQGLEQGGGFVEDDGTDRHLTEADLGNVVFSPESKTYTVDSTLNPQPGQYINLVRGENEVYVSSDEGVQINGEDNITYVLDREYTVVKLVYAGTGRWLLLGDASLPISAS